MKKHCAVDFAPDMVYNSTVCWKYCGEYEEDEYSFSKEEVNTGRQREFVKSGVRMIVYQYLNNLAYIAALLLPYPFVSGKLSHTGGEF